MLINLFILSITAADRALSSKKWYTYAEYDGVIKTKLLSVWSEGDAATITQRIIRSKQVRVLPVDRIIPGALSPLFRMVTATLVERMRVFAKDYPPDARITRTLGLTNTGRCVCATWPIMADFLERYSYDVRIGAPRLATEFFPTGPGDTDEKRLAYARYIQARFVNPEYLGFDPAEEIAQFEAAYPELKIV